MKRHSVALFIFGILIQLAALSGEHATEIPFVLEVVAPAYSRALVGVQTLESSRSLPRGSKGYAEVSRVLMHRASSMCMISNVNGVMKIEGNDKFTIENIRRMDVGMLASPSGSYTDPVSFDLHSKISLFMSDPSKRFYDYELVWGVREIKEAIEQLKTPNILFFCFAMFVFGTLIAILAFSFEHSECLNPVNEREKTNAQESSKPPE